MSWLLIKSVCDYPFFFIITQQIGIVAQLCLYQNTHINYIFNEFYTTNTIKELFEKVPSNTIIGYVKAIGIYDLIKIF